MPELCFPPESPRRQLAHQIRCSAAVSPRLLQPTTPLRSATTPATDTTSQLHLSSPRHPPRTSSSASHRWTATPSLLPHCSSLEPPRRAAWLPPSPLHRRYPVRFCGVFSVTRLSHLMNRLTPIDFGSASLSIGLWTSKLQPYLKAPQS